MRKLFAISIFTTAWLLATGAVSQIGCSLAAEEPSRSNRFEGKYCDGVGDLGYLRLIDESFAFLHANPYLPNLTMVYQPDWDTFEEGAGWGGWWIQNGYGFSYAATPFLQEPWFSTLQHSWDLFWSNQGDGKRMGLWGGSATASPPLSSLVATDGCLGDCAMSRLHRLPARRRQRKDPRLVLRGHGGGRGDAGRNPA